MVILNPVGELARGRELGLMLYHGCSSPGHTMFGVGIAISRCRCRLSVAVLSHVFQSVRLCVALTLLARWHEGGVGVDA